MFEREKAQAKYEDAIAEDKTVAMVTLTKTERSAMRIQLGNFPKKSQAQLTIVCYGQLEIEDLSWCLRVPSVFTPRYIGNMPKFMVSGVAQHGNPGDGAAEGGEEEKFDALK